MSARTTNINSILTIVACRYLFCWLWSLFRDICICSRRLRKAVTKSRLRFFSCSELHGDNSISGTTSRPTIFGVCSCQPHTDIHSGDSSMSANLSSKVMRFASLRLAAAEILDASGPPFGCLMLRSCTVNTRRSPTVARQG